jgi:hypothetical protein
MKSGDYEMMTSTISTLRPGLLVSFKTSVTGNVDYTKEEIERDHTTEEGKRRAKWQTERIITDPEEFERATQARSKCLSLVRTVCARSAFGLLCAEIDRDKLDAAIADARRIADEFNATASLTSVKVYIIIGRVAADDVEAVKAINSEISELMQDMRDGLEKLDVKAVREAAAKAKNVGQMLTGEAQARVATAIELARKSARDIVSAGENAAIEIDRATIARIAEARTAFLDLDEQREIGAPVAAARAVDLEPLEA